MILALPHGLLLLRTARFGGGSTPRYRGRDSWSDEELMDRAADDVEALALLYQRHVRVVLGYCRRRLGDAELAADTTAEIFAVVLREARSRRSNPRAFSPWLHAVTRHKVAETHRRGHAEDRARRRLGLQQIPLGEAAVDQIDGFSDSADIIEELGRLPEDEREAVRARIVYDQAYPDIARASGLSEAAVRQRVHRGLKRLRKHLERE